MPESVQFLVEYLPRIRTSSVVIQGLKEINLKHADSSRLMVQDEQGPPFEILLPHHPGNVTSKRLARISEDEYLLTLKSEEMQQAGSPGDLMTLPQAKWTKRQLSDCNDFKLCCLQCGSKIIDQQNCVKLNDMPSEFWMELMDYWHCHKPDENPSGSYSLQRNSLRPCLNEILIGESFFQVNEDTLSGRVQVKNNLLLCGKCEEPLGKESADEMCKIYKWKLRLTCNGTFNDTFPPEHEIVSTLLNCNRANATRYVLIKCGKQHLCIWLFATGIEVTLNSNKILKNCLKIFYSAEIPPSVDLKVNIDEEEVNLVPFEKFIHALKTVNSCLPTSKQKFGPWCVTYFPMVE